MLVDFQKCLSNQVTLVLQVGQATAYVGKKVEKMCVHGLNVNH